MAGSIDPKLERRARSFKLSNNISRFGAQTRQLPYQPPSKIHQTITQTTPKVMPKTATARILENALDAANSHEQKSPLSRKELKQLRGKRPLRGKGAAYATIGLMAVIVIGYAVYQNLPNVMVKVASVRAGFSAQLPSYHPSGFTLSSVGYRPGIVAFNFLGNIDNRKFTITEHSSNWDSTTLVSSIIVPTEGTNYKQLMVAGQSIYLYGNDQAAWVNNGIWYQVQGDGSLSTNQLIQLATTL